MSHWSVAPGSVAILGRTQTGKTALARELHARSPRMSIFLNGRGDERVPGVSGKRVRDFAALHSGMESNERTYNWLSGDRARDIRRLREHLWALAEATNREFRMQLVIDEAHLLAPQSRKTDLPARDAVRRLAKEGQKRGVKVVCITQDPVALDKQTLRQCTYRAVFECTAEQRHSLRNYGFEWDAIEAAGPHTAVVHHATGSVVDRSRAKKQFVV